MRVIGIDFTSRPSRRKPIAVAEAWLCGGHLEVSVLHAWHGPGHGQLRDLLQEAGPWMAGLDLPFGLPAVFVEEVGWPASWSEYVREAAALDRDELRRVVADYRGSRAPGQPKHPKREVDRLARAASPVNVVRPPVGLMWHAGAPLLLESPVAVVPCRPLQGPAGADPRVVVEAYPALVAEALLGHRRYKSPTDVRSRVERAAAREALLDALTGDPARDHYGIEVALAGQARERVLADDGGDLIDAVCSAVQAAWAWGQRDHGYGVPERADPDEGWIVDPTVALQAPV